VMCDRAQIGRVTHSVMGDLLFYTRVTRDLLSRFP